MLRDDQEEATLGSNHMGWNDHVDFVEMECLDCGQIDVWECWDEVAKVRYGGELGKMLNHDIANSDRCPHCGSTRARLAEEEVRYPDDL
jgi:hypothetical protein